MHDGIFVVGTKHRLRGPVYKVGQGRPNGQRGPEVVAQKVTRLLVGERRD